MVASAAPPSTPADVARTFTTRQFWITASVLAVVAASFEIQQLMVIPMMGLLADSLGISGSAATWVILAALISGAVSTGPLCRLADRIGPKKVYVFAASAILLGNILCAAAISIESATLMFVGRALVGFNIAAAMGVAILKTLGTPKQMQMGMGMVTLGNGVGVVPSFLLAGVLVDNGADLATVFVIAGVLAAACVGLLLLIPHTDGFQSVRIPALSSALIGAWVLPACIYLSVGNTWGWLAPSSLIVLLIAVAALVVWVRRELASHNPLMPLRMLRGNALVGYYATACIGLLAYGYYVMASAFAQLPRDEVGFGFSVSVFESGLILIPAGVLVTLLGPIIGRFMHVWGPKWILVAGSSILAVQFVMMAMVKSELWQMYVYAGVFGVGVAMFLPAGWSIFAMQAKADEIGITSGMALILQMIYGALGTAVGVALTTRSLVPGTSISVESGYSQTFLVYAVAMAVAVVLALRIRTDRDGYVTVADDHR